MAAETLWRLLPSLRREFPGAGGDGALPGEDEREQPDEAGDHPPGTQAVHMAGDCQAEAENLHPLPEGPGEKTGSQHGRVSSVLTVRALSSQTSKHISWTNCSGITVVIITVNRGDQVDLT